MLLIALRRRASSLGAGAGHRGRLRVHEVYERSCQVQSRLRGQLCEDLAPQAVHRVIQPRAALRKPLGRRLRMIVMLMFWVDDAVLPLPAMNVRRSLMLLVDFSPSRLFCPKHAVMSNCICGYASAWRCASPTNTTNSHPLTLANGYLRAHDVPTRERLPCLFSDIGYFNIFDGVSYNKWRIYSLNAY